MEEAVKRIVTAISGQGGWTVLRPEFGSSATTFLADRGDKRLIVKLGADVGVWRRAAEIGVGPRVVEAGEFEGIAYVLLEFVEGSHLTREELDGALDDVMRILRLVHQDGTLRAILEWAGRSAAYQLAMFDRHFEQVRLHFADPRVEAAERLVAEARDQFLHEAGVATHGDVNRKNLIRSGERLFLIDWEGAALADPVRDVGPLLWWHTSADGWKAPLRTYGLALTPEISRRIYWWAACYSLDIAAWFLRRGHVNEARTYLEDFLAAAHSQPNPRRPYRA